MPVTLSRRSEQEWSQKLRAGRQSLVVPPGSMGVPTDAACMGPDPSNPDRESIPFCG